MRVRVLVLGLSFFALAVALAVQPHLAAGHSPKLSKRCTIVGTNGPDVLTGTHGPDVICGRGGADVIAGAGGADLIRGGRGADRLQGDLGADVLQGGAGNDWLWGRDGLHDHLNGGKGFDRYRLDSIDRVVAVEAEM